MADFRVSIARCTRTSVGGEFGKMLEVRHELATLCISGS